MTAIKVTFANQKGGAGKSTLIALLANALSQEPHNYQVTVIDADPQKSLIHARELDDVQEPPYKIIDSDALSTEEIAQLNESNDVLFFDIPGRLELNRSLLLVDWAFVPVRPGAFNAESTIPYLHFLRSVQDSRPEGQPLDVIGCFNMYRERSTLSRRLKAEAGDISEALGVPFMRTRLRNYTLFEDVDTVTSLYDENANDRAKLNFTVFCNEFLKLLSK